MVSRSILTYTICSMQDWNFTCIISATYTYMVDEVNPGLNGEAHSLLQDPGRPQRSQTGLIDPLNSL